jgi:hypothetical protein
MKDVRLETSGSRAIPEDRISAHHAHTFSARSWVVLLLQSCATGASSLWPQKDAPGWHEPDDHWPVPATAHHA